ncbi:MAG: hypothetical protein IPJ61_14985 [Tessaracoccus sp.]|uniref:hypothetical protein n=1 Tax=Tessaracoccus sp. TaxID=1971211 RepID=UPI001ED674B5|nr:hypothetical protein [Tessaracoccus sp.]MBK7822320.1 hypothetical protein [Tessaracoccus sp.]
MSQPEHGQPDPQQTAQPEYSYGQPEVSETPEYGYGQQASYGQPPAYAQASYGYQAPAEHPQAQTVFILGIVGIFVTIVPFIAWYLGGQAKKEIAAGAPYAFEGKLKTGYLLGKVFGILQIVGVVLGILFWAILIPLMMVVPS